MCTSARRWRRRSIRAIGWSPPSTTRRAPGRRRTPSASAAPICACTAWKGPAATSSSAARCRCGTATGRPRDFRDGKQWLLRFFDQIRFYPVSADELLRDARRISLRPSSAAHRGIARSTSASTSRFLDERARLHRRVPPPAARRVRRRARALARRGPRRDARRRKRGPSRRRPRCPRTASPSRRRSPAASGRSRSQPARRVEKGDDAGDHGGDEDGNRRAGRNRRARWSRFTRRPEPARSAGDTLLLVAPGGDRHDSLDLTIAIAERARIARAR